MINQYYSYKQLNYSLYNGIRNTYFGMLSYIMLNLITNKPIKPIPPEFPIRRRRKTSKRISARQVQNNLEAFIKEQRQFNEEQRQVNKVLLEFVVEQREFNKKIMARLDNIVSKNNLIE